MTVLDVSFYDFSGFLAYVRQEWPTKPCQLIKHPTYGRLCVKGQFGEAEKSRLLELVNAYTELAADAPQMVDSRVPVSHKRAIRAKHYRG